ncbi:MAG: hypothetical protein II388_12265, partial [Clostridia bacterium]|nr:hypothetical protein [Clostridia bacterium]
TDYQISTVKTALTTGENSIISGAGTNGTSSTFTGDTLTGITYDYYTYPITENGVKLNNYNRIQFALSKLDNDNNSDEDVQGNYSNFVAFTTFKYNDTWYISDNYVLYKYNSANGIAATEMPAVN